MQILVSIGTVGASPQIGEILPPCDFFLTVLSVLSCPVLSCPYLFFLDPTPRSNRWTDFDALWRKRRTSTQGWSFWGLERWMTVFGGNMPPKLPKNGRE